MRRINRVFCPHCGKAISENELIRRECGAKIIKEGNSVIAIYPKNNFTVMVDKEDIGTVQSYLWYPNTQGRPTRRQNGKELHLAREIMKPKPSQAVYHKNGIPTDCRKSNLCVMCTGNSVTIGGVSARSKTGYKGVTYCKARGHYHARLIVKGKHIYLGKFDNPEAAALAYNEAVKKYLGPNAYLNDVWG